MDEKKITVTVACAFCKPQRLIQVELPGGSTIADAIEQSKIADDCPEFDLGTHPVGIFSRRRERDTVLSDGDQVEIYKQLAEDVYQRRREKEAG